MATTTTGKATGKAGKATTDSKGNPIYLQVTEQREHEYFHLRARVCTQRYEQGEAEHYQPAGVDDDYSDGLLWSGLRCSCQGDAGSRGRAGEGERGAVYGFDVEYGDSYAKIDLRRVRRMAKTLEKIDRGMERLQAARGYVRSYGEYLGRVAEVLGCAGMVFERGREHTARSGYRWRWTTIGEGVNEANQRIWRWTREPIEAAEEAARRAVTTEDASGEAVPS